MRGRADPLQLSRRTSIAALASGPEREGTGIGLGGGDVDVHPDGDQRAAEVGPLHSRVRRERRTEGEPGDDWRAARARCPVGPSRQP
jgi:hypothetical protein